MYTAKKIITMEPDFDRPDREPPTSITTSMGKILSVNFGSALPTSTATVIDFSELFSPEAVIVPGLIETHMHPMLFSDGIALLNLQNPPCATRQAMFTALQELKVKLQTEDADKQPEDYRPLIGWGYDPLMVDDQRPPTREELDELFNDRPVFVYHASVHIAYINTFLFRKAMKEGFDAKTLPADHFIVNAENGEYTGEIREPVALLPVLHALSSRSFEDLVASLRKGLVDLRNRGWTTVCDAFAGTSGLDYHAYQAAVGIDEHDEDSPVPIRVSLFPGVGSLKQAATASHFHTGFGNNRLKIGPKKYVFDGSLQGRTGFVKEPYLPVESPSALLDDDDDNSHCNDRGICAFAQDQLEQLKAQWQKDHELGYQLAVHVNGDAAIETALDIFESILHPDPSKPLELPDHRHRFEHCQLASDETLDRIARLGIHISFFPSHTMYWGDIHVRNLGEERSQQMCRIRSAIERGIPYSLHSDAPVTIPDPMFMMYCACTRLRRSGEYLGKDEAITGYQALAGLTLGAAQLIFEEQHRGSIRPGKLADFTILSADPTTCDPEKLQDISVLGVVLDGKWWPAESPVHLPLPTVTGSSLSSSSSSSTSTSSSAATTSAAASSSSHEPRAKRPRST